MQTKLFIRLRKLPGHYHIKPNKDNILISKNQEQLMYYTMYNHYLYIYSLMTQSVSNSFKQKHSYLK